MSDRRLLVLLKKILAKLGLPGHLHTFRHSCISSGAENGTPDHIWRSWVGHVDDDVIALYIHISDSASPEAMKRLKASTSNPHEAREVPCDETSGNAVSTI